MSGSIYEENSVNRYMSGRCRLIVTVKESIDLLASERMIIFLNPINTDFSTARSRCSICVLHVSFNKCVNILITIQCIKTYV